MRLKYYRNIEIYYFKDGTIVEEFDVIARIEQLCEERGWTHYRLAKASGIPHSTLHNMLYRSTVPTVPSLYKICHAFGISISQFFDSDSSRTHLSEHEEYLLFIYRQLDDTDRSLAAAYLQALYDHHTRK